MTRRLGFLGMIRVSPVLSRNLEEGRGDDADDDDKDEDEDEDE